MKKQGAIILTTGVLYSPRFSALSALPALSALRPSHRAGDNSNSAQGIFYEGIMVTGATTDATDDAVQANIVAVGYTNIK